MYLFLEVKDIAYTLMRKVVMIKVKAQESFACLF